MKIISCVSPEAVAKANIQEFKKTLEKTGKPLNVFLPTGRSPLLTYDLFNNESSFWLDKLRVIQIDEFVDARQIFLKELEKRVIRPLSIKSAQIIIFSWSDNDMQKHIEDVLTRPIDIAFLGLGPNGHVGFHEPGTLGKTFMGGRIKISDATRKRIVNASTLETLTFGVGSFLRAKKIILTVTGDDKREIFKRFLNSEETSHIPASLLKAHPNFVVTTNII